MITSKHASVIVLAGLLGIAVTQEGCSSDTSGPTGNTAAGSTPTGTAGAATGISGGGSAGAPAAVAGAPAAGAPAGGAPAAGGGGAGGSSAGTGGSTATTGGSGGSSGSSAGSGTGGGSAGGGSMATFASVKTLFGASCGVGQCHNKASGNLDFQGTMDLHGLLTTAIPTGIAHCVGSTLVKPNDAAGSFLVTVVKMGGSCPTGGGTIGKMPEGCGTAAKPCLTDTQIKTITDWIAAGAPG